MSSTESHSDDLVKARSLCETLMRRAVALQKQGSEMAISLRRYNTEMDRNLRQYVLEVDRQVDALSSVLRREMEQNPET